MRDNKLVLFDKHASFYVLIYYYAFWEKNYCVEAFRLNIPVFLTT